DAYDLVHRLEPRRAEVRAARNPDRRDLHRPRGAGDPHRHLAAVRDQETVEHRWEEYGARADSQRFIARSGDVAESRSGASAGRSGVSENRRGVAPAPYPLRDVTLSAMLLAVVHCALALVPQSPVGDVATSLGKLSSASAADRAAAQLFLAR